ncbi:MAG: tetratricopeptide repeat protein, partial [Chitinophagaceae bacterium]
MTRILITAAALFFCSLSFAQPKTTKKPANKVPSQAEINKMMEEAMNAEGMSKEEKAQMKEMMKDVMPDMMQAGSQPADYAQFTSNKELIPKKDAARISKMRQKALAQSEVGPYAAGLLAKIMAKAPADEIKIIKKLSAALKPVDMEAAAVEAMMQGHPEAAMALAMKAVQGDPGNTNFQNNMAAMLTEYGHPDLAMPILNKLKLTYPDNSTILNNLAYAWLGLGVTDSAKLFAGAAAAINPSHPDASLCGGLMEELTGDPISKYIESMESSVNPFTEQLIKNRGVEPSLDFNKIKNSIAIYEYFPPDWMPAPPHLHNDVKFYNQDKSTVDGWVKMGKQLTDEVAEKMAVYEKQLGALADKSESEFVKDMTKEITGGMSVMSKPAAAVMRVLMAYQAQSQQNWAGEMNAFLAWKGSIEVEKNNRIKAIYAKIDDSKKTNCGQFKKELDGLENEYM